MFGRVKREIALEPLVILDALGRRSSAESSVQVLRHSRGKNSPPPLSPPVRSQPVFSKEDNEGMLSLGPRNASTEAV